MHLQQESEGDWLDDPRIIAKLNKIAKVEKSIPEDVKEDIRATPEAGGFLSGKLSGLRKWKYRIKGVPYRIVYSFGKDKIEIIFVGKRKDFYEKL